MNLNLQKYVRGVREPGAPAANRHGVQARRGPLYVAGVPIPGASVHCPMGWASVRFAEAAKAYAEYVQICFTDMELEWHLANAGMTRPGIAGSGRENPGLQLWVAAPQAAQTT